MDTTGSHVLEPGGTEVATAAGSLFGGITAQLVASTHVAFSSGPFSPADVEVAGAGKTATGGGARSGVPHCGLDDAAPPPPAGHETPPCFQLLSTLLE